MTVKPTPAPANPTGDLYQRLYANAPIARYPGMDAYAQGLAERNVVSAGPYRQGVSATGTVDDAYRAFRPATNGYRMIGIGHSGDFWVIVLNN